MKKILSILLIIFTIVLQFNITVYSYNSNDYFVVTAYYSPLPDQNYYLTWNYESEKRLNWQWIRWASWKWVFSGMLAAPKNYKFWTKIKLEWLWIWEVSDRWWAIVNAWNRWYKSDRIDVWVWYWDEWLRRALYWGKRTVKWNFVDYNTKVNLDYKIISAPLWATKWLKKISNIFNSWIGIWSNKSSINKLQNLLTEVGLYQWEINWEYTNEIIDIIYNFQLENWLIKNWNTYWAWYWWKNTRALFLKMYLNWNFDTKNKKIIKEKPTNNIESKKIVNKDNILIFNSAINWSDNIKILQNILLNLWLYKWNISWIAKDIVNPIYNYQLSKWIITWISSAWAWNFWPKTRKSLKITYEKYLQNIESKKIEEDRIKEQEKQKKINEENRKKELENKYKKLEELSLKKAEEKIKNIWNPIFWEVSKWVRELQITLKELGYFNYKDTAIYWKITKESIVAFQIDKKIILSKNDFWAWIIWPKTKKVLKNILKYHFMEQISNNDNSIEITKVNYNKL